MMNMIQKELQHLIVAKGVDLMTEEWQEYMRCALQEIERLEESNKFLRAELDRLASRNCEEEEEEEDFDDSMDGDHDSAMTSAGWGTDEDYGYYGEDF